MFGRDHPSVGYEGLRVWHLLYCIQIQYVLGGRKLAKVADSQGPLYQRIMHLIQCTAPISNAYSIKRGSKKRMEYYAPGNTSDLAFLLAQMVPFCFCYQGVLAVKWSA